MTLRQKIYEMFEEPMSSIPVRAAKITAIDALHWGTPAFNVRLNKLVGANVGNAHHDYPQLYDSRVNHLLYHRDDAAVSSRD